MKRVQLNFIWVVIFLLLTSFKGFSEDFVLKAGIAKVVDITPTESLYMGGYDESCRTGSSDGVFGNIYIRSLVFDNGTNKVAFIIVDIVGIPGERTAEIRKIVEFRLNGNFELKIDLEN